MRISILLAFLALQQVHALAVTSISSSSSSSSTTSSTSIRLKTSNRLRRPETCRENLPRKSEDLPALVITGRVKEVYMTSNPSEQANSTSSSEPNRALVNVGRVIKGNQQLVGTDILVGGFNSTSATPCPNYVKPNDTYIILLNQEQQGVDQRRYTIQLGNLLSLNLNNLDRVNAIAADEPYKRRPQIDDILCEAHYCPYGRCRVEENGLTLTCHCPDTCPPLPSPVCGSDNTTYTNECHLIKEGCQRQRPLFVTKEAAC